MGAFWVTEGADWCLVGRVNEQLKELFPRLEGRIAQVTEIYVQSRRRKKTAFSTRHDGVCFAILVDEFRENDDKFNEYLEMVSSDSDSN